MWRHQMEKNDHFFLALFHQDANIGELLNEILPKQKYFFVLRQI